MAVDEVAMSIAVDGFWSFEPLFVVTEGGKDVVIEGNRRLAAVKLLRSSKLRAQVKATDLPEPKAAVLKSLEQVPVIPVKSREEVWRYIGFKHVNGPAKWGSYAKAQYIAFVREKTNAPLAEIAAQIGDRHKTVQRLYRALKVIEQAERAKVYKREFSHRNQFYFSHLVTALDCSALAEFVGVSDEWEVQKPVTENRFGHLKELCTWLWGCSVTKARPVVSCEGDIYHLDEVVACQRSLDALRRGASLNAARRIAACDGGMKACLSEARSALILASEHSYSVTTSRRSLSVLAENIAEISSGLASRLAANTRECSRIHSQKRYT